MVDDGEGAPNRDVLVVRAPLPALDGYRSHRRRAGRPACLGGAGVVGLVVGSRPLTGLDGHQLAPMDAAGKLLLAWLCALAPILAFAAIGLLASVIFGRSPIGLLLPAFGGLGMQLASQVLPMPTSLAHDGSVRLAITFGIVPLLAVWALSAAVVAAAAGATGSGVDQAKLQRPLATSFAHLYRVQSQELYHLNVTEAQLRVAASSRC